MIKWVGQVGLMAASCAALCGGQAIAPPASGHLRGNVIVHDPSTIIRCKDGYWLFATGPRVVSRYSRDLVTWQAGPRVFDHAPAWTTNVVPDHNGVFWAPDAIQVRNRFLLYYSVSKLGLKTSAIGLATNPTLDPTDPQFHWTDQGIVIQSGDRDDFNAIDPSVFQDVGGRLWLVFGSFWSGVKLMELDPTSGRRLLPTPPLYPLAYHESIEAPALCRHNGFYYLFVNWGLCCRGESSTYEIRVGRSPTITGPYLDQRDVDMLAGGGTPVLSSRGQAIGPGHAGFLPREDPSQISYHYYDADGRGRPTLGLGPLRWSAEGWPIIPAATSDKSSTTRSQTE
jgi:arabinan endo-1,5-alpha-L-arabinosidase